MATKDTLERNKAVAKYLGWQSKLNSDDIFKLPQSFIEIYTECHVQDFKFNSNLVWLNELIVSIEKKGFSIQNTFDHVRIYEQCGTKIASSEISMRDTDKVYTFLSGWIMESEKNRLEEAKEYQLILLEGIQSNGYNVVLCCKCGETNIIEHISLPEEEIDFTCIGCGETVAPEDCMDFLS